MRRALGVVVVVALIGVLCPRIALGFAPAPASAISGDFPAQIFSRAFGERSLHADFGTVAAGSLLDESFFSRFALRVATEPEGAGEALVSASPAALPLLSLNLFAPMSSGQKPWTIAVRDDDYRAPAIATPLTLSSAGPSEPVIGTYQGAGPQSAAPPSAFHFDLTSSTALSPRLVTFSPVMNPQQAFTAGASGPDASTTLPQAQAGVAVPMRVGRVHLQTHVEGAQAQQTQLALHDNAVKAGATFDTRVGSRKLDVDLSSGFEHMTVNDPVSSASGFDGTSNYQLSNVSLPVLVPAYADVSKRTLSAGVGMPVSRNLLLQVQYDSQHLQGGYGAPGLSNLDATNNVYGGKVTLQIPHSASAISLSAKQYRYQDNLVPSNAFTQTSADVNFTVKF